MSCILLLLESEKSYYYTLALCWQMIAESETEKHIRNTLGTH